jgi:hypothetical protein
MTEVELARNALLVQVRGMDQLWALKSRLEIPQSNAVGAEVDPEVAVGWKDLRVPGIHVPRVITAGSFYQESERVFWDVHDPEKAVVIQLKEERYARLVIEVDDPYATAATIQKTLGEEHNTSEARS